MEFTLIDKEVNLIAGVYTFGSHEQGTNTPNGDIDAVIVTPCYFDWEKHFFGTLVERLKKES